MPPDTEEHVVKEKERDRSFGPRLCGGWVSWPKKLVVSNANGDNAVAEELTRRGVHHHLASAPAFDVRNADEGEEEVGDGVASREKSCKRVGETDRFNEHGGKVVRCNVDAGWTYR